MSDCLGVVLAGGKSSRMGTDKANLCLANKSLLARAKALLADCGLRNVVVSRQDNINDLFADKGPVGGIYSVLKACTPTAMLIIPVDLPLLTSQSVKQLKTIGELSHKAVFYHENQLPLYLPVSAFLEQYFASSQLFKQSKGPSVKQMLAHIPHHAINLDDPKVLTNVNTPNQWQQIQAQYINKRI